MSQVRGVNAGSGTRLILYLKVLLSLQPQQAAVLQTHTRFIGVQFDWNVSLLAAGSLVQCVRRVVH